MIRLNLELSINQLPFPLMERSWQVEIFFWVEVEAQGQGEAYKPYLLPSLPILSLETLFIPSFNPLSLYFIQMLRDSIHNHISLDSTKVWR